MESTEKWANPLLSCYYIFIEFVDKISTEQE